MIDRITNSEFNGMSKPAHKAPTPQEVVHTSAPPAANPFIEALERFGLELGEIGGRLAPLITEAIDTGQERIQSIGRVPIALDKCLGVAKQMASLATAQARLKAQLGDDR